MPYNNETIEICFHCNKKYIAGCVKGMKMCAECKEAGHDELLTGRCQKCIEEIASIVGSKPEEVKKNIDG